MTNENIPEPIFPSGFTAKEIITPIESLDKLTPEMVDLIKNRDKCILDVYDKNLEFRKEHLKHTRITENNAEITKRIGMGLVFGVIVSVLIYSGVTGDKALTEKVIIGAISGVAGVGGGVLINQQKDKSYIQQGKSKIKYLNKEVKEQTNVTRKSDRCTRFRPFRHNSGNSR